MTEQLERDFQKELTEYARAEGWRVYSVPDSRRASEKGFPDLTLWHPTLRVFLMAELKREKGKLREEQIVVHEELINCGINVFVWRPSDWESIKSILGMPRRVRKAK